MVRVRALFINLVLIFEVIGLVTVLALWLWGMYDAYRDSTVARIA